MISIVIPTRNRPLLLKRLVDDLELRLVGEYEIIIVDSSDNEKFIWDFNTRYHVTHCRTLIKSAAAQRNIGLSKVDKPEFVFFLDDDVLPSEQFFEKTIQVFSDKEVVGVSGLALSTKQSSQRNPPTGLIGLLMRIFQLDSKKDGALLKSGVNIPVRTRDSGAHEVEWLIGCSAWRYSLIGPTRFEADFIGQSLAEDVIFSVRMKKKGKLITDTRIHLLHDESEIERPNRREFWSMWIRNRYRLISIAETGIPGLISFWWANLGQLLILVYMKTKRKEYQQGSISGFIRESIGIMCSKQ